MEKKYILFIYSPDFGESQCNYKTFESWDKLQEYLYGKDETWSQSGDNTRFYYNQSGLYCYPIECNDNGSALHLAHLTPHGMFKLQSSKGVNIEVLSKRLFIDGVYSYRIFLTIE